MAFLLFQALIRIVSQTGITTLGMALIIWITRDGLLFRLDMLSETRVTHTAFLGRIVVFEMDSLLIGTDYAVSIAHFSSSVETMKTKSPFFIICLRMGFSSRSKNSSRSTMEEVKRRKRRGGGRSLRGSPPPPPPIQLSKTKNKRQMTQVDIYFLKIKIKKSSLALQGF